MPENAAENMRQTVSGASSDRGELMEKYKRGESPAWNSTMQRHRGAHRAAESEAAISWPLLSANLQKGSRASANTENEPSRTSSEIERPPSALHSGDFTEEGGSRKEKEIIGSIRDSIDKSYISTPSSWMATSPPRDFTPFQLDARSPHLTRPPESFERRPRGPSLSSSLSSSFVLKAPTSPLVQFESNENLDFGSLLDTIDIGAGLDRKSRRHTLQSSHSMTSTPALPTSLNSSRPLPNLRRDYSFPYQAHQPRRSLISNSIFHDVAFPTPPPSGRSRRPSCASESSPLQLASMVGSYEESILRGRMSTTPSKPLDFVAKIGVLGRGKCKPYLRCPAHVTLPFPAVFYSYGTTSHGRMAEAEDGPSPYVGQIDLEHGIRPKEKKRKRKPRAQELADQETAGSPTREDIGGAKNPEQKDDAPRAPPGGSYRIPEKGQLQIIIKNPNNTAIKLFLVPYDLADMASGTKTFIRQRIYSAGPFIDAPLSATSAPILQPPTGRPILRYLIHLHICCPSKTRFYLYKTIRVVFANRVPDGKETLRSEIQMPEPRFSPWKPSREYPGLTSNVLGSGAGDMLVAEKAFRRRSSGFPLTTSMNSGPLQRSGFDQNTQAERDSIPEGVTPSPYPHAFGSFNRETPITPIPFALDFRRKAIATDAISSQIGSKRSAMTDYANPSPSSQPSSSNTQNSLPGTAEWDKGVEKRSSSGDSASAYDKLSKGDYVYAGQQGVPEGLLAKRLRDLGIDGDGSAAPSESSRLIAASDREADDGAES